MGSSKFSPRYNQLADLIMEIAQHHKFAGEYKETIQLLEKGITQLEEYPKYKAKLIPLLSEILWKTGDIHRAAELLAQNYPEVDDKTLSDILYEKAEVQYILRYFMYKETEHEPIDLHEKALELRRKTGYLEGVSESLSRLGTMYEHQKEDEKAQTYYKEAVELSNSINDPLGLIRPYTHMASYQRDQGNTQESYRLYSESLRLSEEVAPQETVVFSLANLAQADFQANKNFEYSLSLNMRALDIVRKTGFILAYARVLFGIGLLYMQTGENDNAIEYFLQVIQVAEDAGYSYFTKPAQNYINKLR